MFTHKVCLLFAMVLAFCSLLSAQESMQIMCNTKAVTQNSTTQHGGMCITASGSLNVLFVYVQFPDDNYLPNSSYWHKGQAPTYMNATIDSIWSATPTPGGFTDYFNQMSVKALKMTGKSVSAITPHTRKFYLDNRWVRSDIQEDILQQLDATMNFAQFDHWRYDSSYHQTNSPDGVVDMILMMWRNIDSDTSVAAGDTLIRVRLDLRPGGEASLGGADRNGHSSFTIDGGARTIKMLGWGLGSGITAIQPTNSDLSSNLLWRYARHEFGHWLLGGNDYHTQLGTWGLLDGWGSPSGCMNSFERERLGWINYYISIDDISTTRTISSNNLTDFVTTGIVYRIKVPGGGADDYYLLENHQRISQFDVPDNNVSTAKGLFMLHETTEEGGSVGIVSAQGRFNWSVPYQSPNIYGGGGTLPVFQRGNANRVQGCDKRAYIPWTWQGVVQTPAAIHYFLDPVTGALRQAGVNGQGTIFTGDGKDQFDMSNNTVFTPASNPSSDAYNNFNKVGYEVTGINNGVYVIDIFINTVANTSPSKPQNVIASFSSASSVALSWTANTESHMISPAGYDVYRSIYYDGATLSYTKVNSSRSLSPSFIDNPTIPSGIPVGKDVYWRYNIKAIDNAGKVSVASEDFWLFIGKSISGTISNSTTWDVNRLVVGTVTINNGAVLTVSPNTSVFFAYGSSLIVGYYGNLTAIGSQSSPITFNFISPNSSTQNGIQFTSSSMGTISYCKILNAYNGIYENGVSINISNSAISNCANNGIYLYSSNPTIQNNNIHNNAYGINLISSSPVLLNNYIQNNSTYGVYCSTNSNPKFGNGSTQGKNNLTGNNLGIFIYNNSIPMIGKSSPLDGGYNNLVNTSYNIYNMTNNTIYANDNWWGSTNPANFKIGYLGSVLYSPYLTSSVSIPAPPLSKSSGNLIASNSSDIPMLSELNKANELIAANNLGDARIVCLNLITNYPDYSISYNALNLLKETYPANEISNTKDIYKSLFNTKGKKNIYAMAGLILANIDKGNKLNLIDNVISTYKNESVVELALFDKFVCYYFDKADKQNALAVSKELDQMFPQSQGAVEAHRILGDKRYDNINVKQEQPLQKTVVETPISYALLGNYPNPFNPSTIINYQLPEAARVTLKVYDMLGREVATLVDGMKETGNYSVTFDGSSLSSGIYFTRMIVQPQEGKPIIQVKKMLLMK
jgi:hypothetical protein